MVLIQFLCRYVRHLLRYYCHCISFEHNFHFDWLRTEKKIVRFCLMIQLKPPIIVGIKIEQNSNTFPSQSLSRLTVSSVTESHPRFFIR